MTPDADYVALRAILVKAIAAAAREPGHSAADRVLEAICANPGLVTAVLISHNDGSNS